MKTESFAPVGGLDMKLVELGSVGIHLLFDPDTIKQAFWSIEQEGVDFRSINEAHIALRQLSNSDNLFDAILYLKTLPDRTLFTVVFLYFRTLDQFMAQDGITIH